MPLSSFIESAETNDYYLFQSSLNAFFGVIEYVNLTDARIPSNLLHNQFVKIYTDNGAVLAEGQNIPSKAQVNAMTQIMSWAATSTHSGHQLQMKLDPQYNQTQFIKDVNSQLTSWIEHYLDSSSHDNNEGAIIGVSIFIGVVACCLIGGALLFHRWKQSNRVDRDHDARLLTGGRATANFDTRDSAQDGYQQGSTRTDPYPI